MTKKTAQEPVLGAELAWRYT